jgi:hypothetical protein
MINFDSFDAGFDGQNWYLRVINNTPTLSPLVVG